jgi:hypothetical protein
MLRHDWLSIGLKLLGVYFGISGLAALWNVMLVLMAASSHGAHVEGIGAIGILQPAAYLIAAFLLASNSLLFAMVWRIGTRYRNASKTVRVRSCRSLSPSAWSLKPELWLA